MKIEILHPSKLSLDLEQLSKLIINEYKKENIQEMSKGMLYRDPNSLYEKDGKKFHFIKSELLPSDTGAFKTQEEFDKTLESKIDEEGFNNVLYFGKKDKAALIILLQEIISGEQILIVKYFKKVSPSTKWQEGNFSKETGFERLKNTKNDQVSTIASSKLEDLKIKPKYLIGDEERRNAEDLFSHILKKALGFKQSEELDPLIFEHIQALNAAFAKNQEFPVLANGAKYSNAYSVYLSEILAPICFVKNWQVTGDRAEAEEKILGSGEQSPKFSDMEISFNNSTSERLIDSTLIHPQTGNHVFLSSKAGAGASSAISNFDLRLKELIDPNKTQDKKLLKQNTDFYKNFSESYPIVNFVIKTIGEETWWNGPIKIALDPRFSLIDEKDKVILDFLKKNLNLTREQYIQEIKVTTPKLAALCENFLGTPETLKDASLIKGSYRPSYHLIAAVAKGVAAKINLNEKKEINFNEAVKMLMNKFGVIQINSKVKIINKQDCQFQKFVVKYPPIFAGQIIADADKNYWASGNNGRINFKIK